MTMKSGKYYVGDLCYVMHDVWDEVCELTFPNPQARPLDGEFTLKDGRRFAIYSTAFGDGEYPSNIGTSHCVDSGTIGCILLDEIRDNTDSLERMIELAAVVEFDVDFETERTDKGLICIGHVEIDTDPQWDEDSGDLEWDD